MDPTRFAVTSHAVPTWERVESFQDIMAAQLTRAPWLLLSVLVHGLVVMLFLLMATSPMATENIRVLAVIPTTPPVVLEPPPPPEVPVELEEPPIEPRLVNTDLPPITPSDAPVDDFLPPTLTPPEMSGTLGLGGGGSMPARYRERRPEGGNRVPPIVNSVVDRGLAWLANHQDDDGRWDADEFMKHDIEGEASDGPGSAVHDVGVTGLALLAFLANNNTMSHGQYRDEVKNGVLWLREQQGDNGLFGTNTSHDFVYDHAIAAYAMCEAYGLSDFTLLRPIAQAGIDYLEAHRNPYGVWRYQPRDGDDDTSVTGWAVLAYNSAQDFDLQTSETALQNAATWLDEVTDNKGRAGYTRRGELSSRHPGQHGDRYPPDRGEALTAVGLLCRFFLGQDPTDHPIMVSAADTILDRLPVWDEGAGTIDHYYWYYASYALFQSGGKHWSRWSRELDDAVIRTQRKDGNSRGSWDPVGVWGEDGGRVYSTAMMVLTMQAYYRYTRLLR